MPSLRRSCALLSALLLHAGFVCAEEPPLPFPPASEIAPSLAWTASEDYTVDTLWEKIDGEAELYRLYGLTEASFARYEDPGDPDRTVEIGLYRLPSSLAAFGLFASHRPAGAADGQDGNGAAFGDYQGFLWHGRVFIIVEAFGSDEFRARVLQQAVHATAARMGEPPQPPAALLAMDALSDPGTVRFRPDHLLGRESLPPGLEGRKGSATLLLAATTANEELPLDKFASSLADRRQEMWDGVEVLLGDDRYLGSIALAVREGRIFGVLSPPSSGPLRPILLRLLDSLPAAP